MQLPLALALILVGLTATTVRLPILSTFDFQLTWYGLILLLDKIVEIRGGRSLLSQPFSFFLLLLASIPFWLFFEWANIFLVNWLYPDQYTFGIVKWTIFASVSFATVLPAIVVSTNLVATISGKLRNEVPKQAKVTRINAGFITILGATILLLVLNFPANLFPFIWVVIFLILDPINAARGQESIMAQVIKGNYQTLLVLSLGAIVAGLIWESVNFIIPKWTYPLSIAGWFWNLPAPINSKIFQMPVAGYLGYIPFSWSAFSFVKFLKIEVPWLSNK